MTVSYVNLNPTCSSPGAIAVSIPVVPTTASAIIETLSKPRGVVERIVEQRALGRLRTGVGRQGGRTVSGEQGQGALEVEEAGRLQAWDS